MVLNQDLKRTILNLSEQFMNRNLVHNLKDAGATNSLVDEWGFNVYRHGIYMFFSDDIFHPLTYSVLHISRHIQMKLYKNKTQT